MRFEIKDAIDKGDKIVLKMDYDEEFSETLAKIFKVKRITPQNVENFVAMVLEKIDEDELRELGYQIDE